MQVPEIQNHKYGVSVTLVSQHEGERTVLNTTGEVIAKGQQLFIRYVEPGQGPQGEEIAVRTMIKIAGSELKLIRHGAVESEQSFQEGQRLPGFYRSPYTNFNLSTETRKLEISRDGRSLNVTWEYDLYVYEELSGQFVLSLHIQEEPKS
ncbi:DUF1934 domain-containing protein [Paenibacillus sp. JW14]|uniref:DUF1934 domain-containing protein n=1 Tax=Paenibacillus agri TaxID=2744309 RepID=A0A850EM58_9BACL|nr:DUF1934 domain-containing protein [Paenibacillus agri]